LLETIPNPHPDLPTHIRLINPFASLCPMSGEPQPGSTITISYTAGAILLETKALRRYLESFAGENPYGVRDLEEAVQVIARHAADTLKVPVRVTARYLLQVGEMEVETTAEP
jgi:NADPH-dependent 7-cyano-7-deazaguanine reductase QueF